MDRIAEALEIVRRAKALGDYDSNVIGMAAEIVAEERFGLKRTSSGSKDIDGHVVVDGVTRSVQVKGFSSGRIQRYQGGAKFAIHTSGCADMLLVLVFYAKIAEYEVVFYGPTRDVGKVSGCGTKRIVFLRDLATPKDVARICGLCAHVI